MAGLNLPVHADILHIESTGKCLGLEPLKILPKF